jgi:hypothetical protein
MAPQSKLCALTASAGAPESFHPCLRFPPRPACASDRLSITKSPGPITHHLRNIVLPFTPPPMNLDIPLWTRTGIFFLPLVIIEKPNLRDSSPGTAILSAPGLHLSRHIHHAPPTASPRLFQSSLIRLAPPPTTAHDRHSPSDA